VFDQLGMTPRLGEVRLEGLGELAVTDRFLARLQQLGRLLFDRVRVGQILRQLIAQIVRPHGLQGSVDRAVEETREPVHHRLLLTADATGGGHDIRLPRRRRHEAEQLVRRALECLVGRGMCHQLAGPVRLRAREQHEPDPARRRGNAFRRPLVTHGDQWAGSQCLAGGRGNSATPQARPTDISARLPVFLRLKGDSYGGTRPNQAVSGSPWIRSRSRLDW
jgi:hypothetical protein